MDKLDDVTVRSVLVNRTVALVFAILASFVLVLQAISQLGLDPFASIVVRLLVIPGYVVMLGYVVLLVNLFPDVGQIGWLLGLVIYLYVISVLVASVYQYVR